MTQTKASSYLSPDFGRASIIALSVCAYAIWIATGFAESDAGGIVTVLCAVASVLISAVILSTQHFNPLSPVGMLLLFTQLYFAARFSFATARFGGWHTFVFVCYLLYLLGILIVLQARLFGVSLVRPLTSRFELRSAKTVYVMTFLCLLVYVAIVFCLLKATNDDLSPLTLVLSSLATRLAIAEQGLSAVLLLSSAFSTIGLSGAFILTQHYKRKTPLVLWVITLALASMALGSRGQLVIPLLQLVIAAAVCARSYLKLLIWTAPPLTVFTVVFSTWFLSVREGGADTPDDYSIFDRFDAYRNWLEALSFNGTQFSFGESIGSAMAQVVPRSVFPEKPFYFSTEMTRRFFNDAFQIGINLDFGGIAESFYNFHFIGPVLFGAFTGWLCRLMYHVYIEARRRSSPVLAIVYAQGMLLPASFFFVSWINSNLIFVTVGYYIFSFITVNVFCVRKEA